MNINEAKILITGGTSGIGLETAKHLKELGATVFINGRDDHKMQNCIEEYGFDGGLAGDVASEEFVISLVQTAITTMGGLNVLINNAAFGYFDLLTNIKMDQFDLMFATNVRGAMMVARECAKYMTTKQYGNIINISSTGGRKGFAMGTAYSASKFAISAMTECWRDELRKYNIRVMQVNPSEVQTNFRSNSKRESSPPNSSLLQATEIAHTIASMLSMNDNGFITEVTVWATNPQS